MSKLNPETIQHQLARVTGIGRIIHPDYPTNRAILVFSVLVTLAAFAWRLINGAAPPVSGVWALSVGLSVFIAWMISRELDPDFDLGAFVAAALALSVLFVDRRPNYIALVWVVQQQRILNRSTGLLAKPSDSLVMIAFGAFLAVQTSWIYAMLSVVTLALDSQQPPANRRQVYLAGLALAAGLGAVILSGNLDFSMPGEWLPVLFSLGAAGIFELQVLSVPGVTSVGDVTGEPLHMNRVRTAGAMTLVIGVAAGIWLGWEGVIDLLPMWAGVLGTAFYRGWRKMLGTP